MSPAKLTRDGAFSHFFCEFIASKLVRALWQPARLLSNAHASASSPCRSNSRLSAMAALFSLRTPVFHAPSAATSHRSVYRLSKPGTAIPPLKLHGQSGGARLQRHRPRHGQPTHHRQQRALPAPLFLVCQIYPDSRSGSDAVFCGWMAAVTPKADISGIEVHHVIQRQLLRSGNWRFVPKADLGPSQKRTFNV